MAYPALKKYTYLGQLGIFIGFIGGGIVLAALVNLIPFFVKPELRSLIGSSQEEIMAALLVPENTELLRIIQFISTFLLFFIPPVVYAWICHKKTFTHLGYKKSVNIPQFFIVIAIMLACLPFVGLLGQLTEMMPFSEATLKKFKLAEEEYLKQVEIIGRMDNVTDYLVSMFMLAILPALFEETLFRGGVQNLLSRWWKSPILAIVITSLIFSAVHFSYIGFLSRVALSFILGWMYYRTGNLWLSIIAHITNNAVAITVLYVMKLKNPAIKMADADPSFPVWIGLFSALAVAGLLYIFEKVNKHQVENPGQELVMEPVKSDPFST